MIDPLFLCGDEVPEVFDPRTYKKKCNKRRLLYVVITVLLVAANFGFLTILAFFKLSPSDNLFLATIYAILFLGTFFFAVHTMIALLVPSSLEFYANDLIWEEKTEQSKP